LKFQSCLVIHGRLQFHSTINFKLRKGKSPVKLLGCGCREDESRHPHNDVSPLEIAPYQNFSKGDPIKRFAQGRQNPKAGSEEQHFKRTTYYCLQSKNCWHEVAAQFTFHLLFLFTKSSCIFQVGPMNGICKMRYMANHMTFKCKSTSLQNTITELTNINKCTILKDANTPTSPNAAILSVSNFLILSITHSLVKWL